METSVERAGNTDDMRLLDCRDAREWRRWLSRNHRSATEIWLVLHKGAGPGKGLTYSDALDEALCHGWIDGILRRIDEQRYARRFTARRPSSNWSPTNKRRVEKLIEQGRMTPQGREAVQKARENGSWDRPDRPPPPAAIPKELEAALRKNKSARDFFAGLAPSHRQRYVWWIAAAKTKETVDRRVREAIQLLEKSRTWA